MSKVRHMEEVGRSKGGLIQPDSGQLLGALRGTMFDDIRSRKQPGL